MKCGTRNGTSASAFPHLVDGRNQRVPFLIAERSGGVGVILGEVESSAHVVYLVHTYAHMHQYAGAYRVEQRQRDCVKICRGHARVDVVCWLHEIRGMVCYIPFHCLACTIESAFVGACAQA